MVHVYKNFRNSSVYSQLIRAGMTHIFIGKLTIIGSNNGLSPGRRQAIIWTNAGILLIDHSKQSSENVFENVVWKMAAILSRPQCV